MILFLEEGKKIKKRDKELKIKLRFLEIKITC